MVKWGPLPETRDMWILWGGPGGDLVLFHGDTAKPESPWCSIRHSSASGTYGTLAEAEKAVNAFVKAGIT